MKPRPIRMPDELWQDLEAEAGDRGLGTAEYVRHLLRRREAILQADTKADTQANTQANTLGRFDELEDRIETLEEKVANADDVPPTAAAETDSRGAERGDRGGGPDPAHNLPDDDNGQEPGGAGVDRLLREWRPGRTAEEREERLDSARAVLEYIQERGSATKGDLVEDVYPDRGVDSQSERTWWRKTARGQLDEGTGGALAIAAAAGHVDRQQGPPHVYRWVG